MDFQCHSDFEGKEGAWWQGGMVSGGVGEGDSLWWLCSGRRRKDGDCGRRSERVVDWGWRGREW